MLTPISELRLATRAILDGKTGAHSRSPNLPAAMAALATHLGPPSGLRSQTKLGTSTHTPCATRDLPSIVTTVHEYTRKSVGFHQRISEESDHDHHHNIPP